MYSRVNLGFGGAIFAIAAISGILLAASQGQDLPGVIAPLVGGGCLAFCGWIGRDPRRIGSVWLFGVISAAGVGVMTARGLSNGSAGHAWWVAVQGALLVLAVVDIVVIALLSYQEGKRRAAELEVQRQEIKRPSRRSRRR